MLACLELADESGTAAYQPQLKLEVFTSNDRSWPIPVSHQTLADDRNPFEAEQADPCIRPRSGGSHCHHDPVAPDHGQSPGWLVPGQFWVTR